MKRKSRPSVIDVEVGRRLQALRLAKGISQTALGNELGLSFQQVQKYERGANRISAGRLYEVAQFFDVPVATFFPDDAGDETQASIALFGKHAMKAAMLVNDLDPVWQRRLVGFIKAMHQQQRIAKKPDR